MSYQNIQPPAPPTQDGTGFFGALFDFSFNTFVTPKIVKVVYILATFALGIAYVVLVLAGFMQRAGRGIAILVLGALGVVLYLALIRMTLEFYYSIVRMSQDIHSRLPRG
jgi:hypothetical protein